MQITEHFSDKSQNANPSDARGVQRHTRRRKMRQKSLGGAKIRKFGGTKFTFYLFVLSENKRIKPITEILGDRNKEVGRGATVLGHSTVPLPFQ